MTRTPRAAAPRLRRLLLCALLLAFIATPAAAAAPDWNAAAEVDTVEIVTADEDGSARETTIWLAVVDGHGYIRTSDTSWGANIVRNPEVTLRIGESEYPLRVEFVEDDALRARIEQTFRAKYGFSDSWIAMFRSERPKIMRLQPH